MPKKRRPLNRPLKKQLLLLRHAKSEGMSTSKADIDRLLLPSGKDHAHQIGHYIQTTIGTPDRILCSPAQRTQQTLEKLQLPPTNIRIEPTLYGAYASTLLQRIEEQSNAITILLLIGHNPSISQLASRLARTFLGDLPICGLVHLEINATCWTQIPEASTTLLAPPYSEKRR